MRAQPLSVKSRVWVLPGDLSPRIQRCIILLVLSAMFCSAYGNVIRDLGNSNILCTGCGDAQNGSNLDWLCGDDSKVQRTQVDCRNFQNMLISRYRNGTLVCLTTSLQSYGPGSYNLTCRADETASILTGDSEISPVTVFRGKVMMNATILLYENGRVLNYALLEFPDAIQYPVFVNGNRIDAGVTTSINRRVEGVWREVGWVVLPSDKKNTQPDHVTLTLLFEHGVVMDVTVTDGDQKVTFRIPPNSTGPATSMRGAATYDESLTTVSTTVSSERNLSFDDSVLIVLVVRLGIFVLIMCASCCIGCVLEKASCANPEAV